MNAGIHQQPVTNRQTRRATRTVTLVWGRGPDRTLRAHWLDGPELVTRGSRQRALAT